MNKNQAGDDGKADIGPGNASAVGKTGEIKQESAKVELRPKDAVRRVLGAAGALV